MKNKALKIVSAVISVFGIFMASGWSFFDLMIHCRNRKNLTKKKWFQLSHTKINHPRDKFEKEYEDGKAWCWRQNKQDCYIRSKDGLLLHGFYLPAAREERYVILSHGYKGSSFGDFAYTARFLHENGCNLLFMDQRCCGLSEGKYITFGAKEQWDVQQWTYYIAKKNKKSFPFIFTGNLWGRQQCLWHQDTICRKK